MLKLPFWTKNTLFFYLLIKARFYNKSPTQNNQSNVLKFIKNQLSHQQTNYTQVFISFRSTYHFYKQLNIPNFTNQLSYHHTNIIWKFSISKKFNNTSFCYLFDTWQILSTIKPILQLSNFYLLLQTTTIWSEPILNIIDQQRALEKT